MTIFAAPADACGSHDSWIDRLGDEMSETSAGTFEIHSEARGPHWVAWLTRGDDPRPVLSVLLVGQTREEAEQRAREWTDQVSGYSAS